MSPSVFLSCRLALYVRTGSWWCECFAGESRLKAASLRPGFSCFSPFAFHTKSLLKIWSFIVRVCCNSPLPCPSWPRSSPHQSNLHRSPPTVPLALFFDFKPFSTFSAFGSAWPDHVPSSLSRCSVSRHVSTVSCLTRICSPFLQNFSSSLSVPFLCFHTSISLPSHSHECRVESGLKLTISVHKNSKFYWKRSVILCAKECNRDWECEITNAFFLIRGQIISEFDCWISWECE